ncbi:MAG: hypothetical protein AB8G17_16470 [Gammaproteobacteria bacterium]
MKEWKFFIRVPRWTLTSIAFAASTAVVADEVDMFSRANCINNESITYNFFDPPQWRLTFSIHFDTQNNYQSSYVASGPLAFCDFSGCWYQYQYTTRAAAVDWGAGGVPGVSDRWFVNGDHRHFYPGVGFTHYPTAASDCNLSFDQFG